MTTDIGNLPPKQKLVLETILAFIEENGYPPAIQQLCELCGVRSTSTIHHHISALKKKGFIHWNPAEKRAISVREDLLNKKGTLPIKGTIIAGNPIEAIEEDFEYINLAEDLCPPDCYALRVKGQSMIEDHIMDGDIVIINPKARIIDGDVVVALVNRETATLKRIYREADSIRLQPSNAEMEPIYATDVEVQGKAEAIIRRSL